MFGRIAIIITLLFSLMFARFLFSPLSLAKWFNPAKFADELSRLRLENEKLRASIEALNQSAQSTKIDNLNFVTAKVYSTYPFSNKVGLAINAGKDSGLQEGMAVMVGQHILLGKISGISKYYSTVQTIFDNKWQLPVRIGETKVDAVLVGGVEPRLTMISSKKEIQVGESVYGVDIAFPYGSKIGKIQSVISEPTATFKEATLELPYNLNEVGEVLVWVD